MKKPALTKKPSQHGGLVCKGLFWVEGNEELFIGKGRIMLLEKISETDSLPKAAKAMGISFHHAKDFVDSMNRQAHKPLVALTGNDRNATVTLTAEGRKAIRIYKKYHDQLDKILLRMEKELSA